MSISAKDFSLIAKKLSVIRVFNPENFTHNDPVQQNYNRGKWQGWAEAVNAIADACAELNPKFNKTKFIEECND